jgi:hypothetical protein
MEPFVAHTCPPAQAAARGAADLPGTAVSVGGGPVPVERNAVYGLPLRAVANLELLYGGRRQPPCGRGVIVRLGDGCGFLEALWSRGTG